MSKVGRRARWRLLPVALVLAAVTACGGDGGNGNGDADGAGNGGAGGEGGGSRTGHPEARPAGPAEALPALPDEDTHGITVESWELVDASARSGQWRLADVTVTTDAIFQQGEGAQVGAIPVEVRILLPPDYHPGRDEPYPVLYLLHGGNGDYQSWSLPADATPLAGGDVVDVVGGQDAFEGIVVMPDGGRAGWYTDWAGDTAGGFRPAWETFHMEQLVPWVDANFHTSGDRDGRAVAGLSMGGYGALRYAARHPDLFSAVGAMSPGTDIRPPESQNIVNASLMVLGASVSDNGAEPPPALETQPEYRLPDDLDTQQERLEAVLGPQSTWPESNPLDLASEYDVYDGRLALYSGNTGDDAYIARMTDAFHTALGANGVGHRYCRGPGNHDWPWWRADLADFLQVTYGTTPATCTTNQGWAEVP